MESYIKEALEIVRAQAGVRTMTEEEITSMVRSLAKGIKSMHAGDMPAFEAPIAAGDPLQAIKEKTITCLEDGKSYKILTKKTLAKFGLTPDEYRAKWGYQKNLPLVCKALQRERRKKMKDMKLWEKRMKG
ncbi:MAG: MucR family transcriptional regulator [Desulfovibrio sp.]|nr:MucR family transcriptional regulator [Desulfovibrio sp.]MCA1985382.1 MucR family transcriptional regulator [Desulfovibrio sp.]